jgi:hypothetical protein
VEITSFRDGDQYPLGSTSLLRLAAHVTDAEHTDEQLTYAWRTFLHHNDHFHPDPVKFDRESYMLISPLGCEQEIYFFRIELTVTDPEGLATTVTQYVYPYCDAPFIDDVNLAAQVNETEIDLLLRMRFSQDVERVEIQRSHDYFHFEVIGELSTQGSIIDPSMHLFTDEAPLRGTNMYRAKVRTVDGAFVYSNLVSVAFPRSKDWRVYPNPAHESLTFAIQEATTERVELELFNMAGQRYHHAGFAAVPGEAWEKLVLVGDLMPGVYSYRLVNGEVVYTGQVVIL